MGLVIGNVISIVKSEITEEQLIQNAILQEDGFFLLQENDDYLLQEN